MCAAQFPNATLAVPVFVMFFVTVSASESHGDSLHASHLVSNVFYVNVLVLVARGGKVKIEVLGERTVDVGWVEA